MANSGCAGGNFKSAYEYVGASGLALFEDYPWEGAQADSCRADGAARAVSMEGGSQLTVPKCDVEAAKAQLTATGPLSVSVGPAAATRVIL